jgi:hypothetical protein
MTFEPNTSGTPQPPEPFQPVTPEPTAVPTSPVASAPVTVSSNPGPVRKKSSGGSRWLNVVLVVAAAVAIGGVAFAVGRGTAAASVTTGSGNGRFGNGAFPGGSFVPGASGAPGFGRGGFGGGLGGGLTVQGTVESVNGDTLTIKTANGQTITVSTGASTTYHTQTDASATDVQAGKTVQVQLAGGGGAGRPNASATTGGPVGTAGSVTVIP